MVHNDIKSENSVSTQTAINAIRREQPALRFPDDDKVGRPLVTVLKRQMDRLDTEIEKIYDQRFVETATGPHLERIAAGFDIKRKTDESDVKLRKRIKAARNVAQSRGTYRDVAQVALDVLDANPSQIELVRPRDHGQMGLGIIRVDGSVLDNSPFTNDEIESILSDAVVGGHRIRIEQIDAFRFGDPDNGWGTAWAEIIE